MTAGNILDEFLYKHNPTQHEIGALFYQMGILYSNDKTKAMYWWEKASLYQYHYAKLTISLYNQYSRPLVNCDIAEIEKLTNDHINNSFVITKIFHELAYRAKKREDNGRKIQDRNISCIHKIIEKYPQYTSQQYTTLPSIPYYDAQQIKLYPKHFKSIQK